MPSKFQFDSVMKLLAAGVNNYVQIRQQVGLTSDELDDIIAHIDYYKKFFAEQERVEVQNRLKNETKKKPWWRR